MLNFSLLTRTVDFVETKISKLGRVYGLISNKVFSVNCEDV